MSPRKPPEGSAILAEESSRFVKGRDSATVGGNEMEVDMRGRKESIVLRGEESMRMFGSAWKRLGKFEKRS